MVAPPGSISIDRFVDCADALPTAVALQGAILDSAATITPETQAAAAVIVRRLLAHAGITPPGV